MLTSLREPQEPALKAHVIRTRAPRLRAAKSQSTLSRKRRFGFTFGPVQPAFAGVNVCFAPNADLPHPQFENVRNLRMLKASGYW